MKIFTRPVSIVFSAFLLACGGGGGGSDSADSAPLRVAVELVAQGLNFPVGLAVAPDGRIFFTELKTGRIQILQNGALQPEPFAVLPVPAAGEDGLLGVAVDPDFSANGFVYAFHSVGNPPRNRVVRLTEQNGVGTALAVLLDDLPSGGHNGGKFAFADDGTMFVSTGDAGFPDSAQDPGSFAGKILHITRDGGVLPAASPIFASGFRNVFGLAVHPGSGTLYATDNGPDCDDEINRIAAGGDYGWRLAQTCGESDSQFVQPLTRINPPVGITGAVFYTGGLFPELEDQLLVGDFNTGAIRRFSVEDPSGGIAEQAQLVAGGAGPVLDLAVGPDGVIYFTGQSAIFRIVRAPA